MPDVAATGSYGDRILYLAIFAGLAFLFFIIQLVRKRKLSERFALAWMLIPVLLIIFSSNRALLERLAAMAGIYYAPALMIPIIFALFILVSLYFSIKACKSEQQIKALAQEVALLRQQITHMQDKSQNDKNYHQPRD